MASLYASFDWQHIIPQLNSYAHKKTAFVYWNSPEGQPGGCLPEDLAFKAISLTLSGVRNYSSSSDPCLLHYLKNVVDSLVYNQMYTYESRTRTNASARLSKNVCAFTKFIDSKQETWNNNTPEAIMLNTEERNKITWALQSVINELDADNTFDSQEIAIISAYAHRGALDECLKPASMRAYLGLTAAEFSAARRRVQRKLKETLRRENDC